MRPIRPTVLAASVLAVLALLLAPCAALADGDPASDVLPTRDTFFPYQPKVSTNVAAAVNDTVARARAAGFPIKVAIVAAPTDLGAVSDMFGKPQKYAAFLDSEISFNRKVMLLVVMPQGFGVAPAGPPGVLAGGPIPPGSGADGLARAAMPAIGALAAHAGHPIALPPIPSSSGSSGSSSGGGSALLTFGAPLALVLLLAGVALIRRGSAPAPEHRHKGGDQDDADEGPS